MFFPMAKFLLTNNNKQLIADRYTFGAKIKSTQKKDCLSIRNTYNDFQIDNVFIYGNWQYPSNEVTNFDRTTDFYQVYSLFILQFDSI